MCRIYIHRSTDESNVKYIYIHRSTDESNMKYIYIHRSTDESNMKSRDLHILYHRCLVSMHVWCPWILKKKHNAKLQQTDPGTKVTGEFSTLGRIFTPYARNGLKKIISIVLVGKKYTEMIGHMPWLYQ